MLMHKFGSTDIPSRLILSLTPSSASSGQHQFNHTDCPAGTDTKKRLYIKIPHARPWERVAYCHNCGGSGFAKLRNDNWLGKYQLTSSAPDRSKVVGGAVHKVHITYPPDNWNSKRATAYIEQFLSQEEVVDFSIGYAPDMERLVYHSHYDDGTVGTTQYRALYQGQKPKYLTDRNPDKVQQCDPIKRGADSDTLILTEDLISAIVVSRSGAHAMPCFGTHLPTEVLHNLSKQYSKIFVWFDNDNEIVIKQAKDMARTLQLLNTKEVGYMTAEEPKKLFKALPPPNIDILLGITQIERLT